MTSRLPLDGGRQRLEALDRPGIAGAQQQAIVVGPATVQDVQQRIDWPLNIPLLKGHPDINALDSKGWTSLDRAEIWHHADVAQLLVEHGALHGAQLRH